MFQPLATVLLIALVGCSLPDLTLAQSPEGTLTLPTSITVRDAGWSQIANTEELLEFFLSVIETLLLAVAFAFHPRGNALRQDTQGWSVQVSIFLFGLIGMFVGFLVIHHGYLIGFVIFGLGSLFRFRMASNSLVDGAILIIVTLVGLAVGLNLPVMALVATVAGWATLWFVTARKTSVVEVKFDDDDALRAAIEPLKAAFEAKSFRIVSMRKNDFKPTIEFVLSHSDSEAVSRVPGVLDDLGQAGHRAKGWHVS
ncbi:hypothetical protein [uncultured Shimia sp.]|uniref:hypothetical protein n=1 Tax=uncultured Shimia sp. TaxID=573152 RepID=UPI002621FE15|nr:hypothetical protein [uncultured Shimia sp.]